MDADAAGRRRARQLLGRARCSRATGRSRKAPSSCGRARRRAADDDDVPYKKIGQRLVPGRRVPPSGLPRRRDARPATSLIAGDPLKGTVDGAVPVRRADGQAAGDVDVHAHAAGFDAPAADHRASSRRERWTFVGCVRRRRRRGAGRCRRDDDDAAAQTASCRSTLDDRRATPACRTSTRSKATSRTSRGSTSPTAPALIVHPAPWYIGVRRPPLLRRAEETGSKTEIVAVGLDGTAVAGRAGRRHADADPVEQRPPRRRQRLLHLGHRAQGSAGRLVDGDDRRRAGAARRPAAGRRLLHARGDAPTRSGPLHGDARRRSTRSATATPRGQRYDHNRIDLVPERRPTSRATPRGS